MFLERLQKLTHLYQLILLPFWLSVDEVRHSHTIIKRRFAKYFKKKVLLIFKRNNESTILLSKDWKMFLNLKETLFHYVKF